MTEKPTSKWQAIKFLLHMIFHRHNFKKFYGYTKICLVCKKIEPMSVNDVFNEDIYS